MNKRQIHRVYQRPEIKVIYVSIDSSILEASYPGDHQKGEHKTGPSEESSTGAKRSFFFRISEESTPTKWDE